MNALHAVLRIRSPLGRLAGRNIVGAEIAASISVPLKKKERWLMTR